MTAAATVLVVAGAAAALVVSCAVAVSLHWQVRPHDPRLDRPERGITRHPLGTLRRSSRVGADRRGTAIAVLEHTARELRAGSSLSAALGTAFDAHPLALVDVRDGLRRGYGARAVIEAALTGARSHTTDERLVLQALYVCRDAGRSAPDVLERAADVLRERQAWQRERHSQAAQARLSGRVLTALPIVFALWSALTDGGVREAYRASPVPLVCTAVGVALNLAGWWWMRRLTGRAP